MSRFARFVRAVFRRASPWHASAEPHHAKGKVARPGTAPARTLDIGSVPEAERSLSGGAPGRIPPGRIVCGHYRILESIGRGGMGEVFKAQDTRLDRFIALKFLTAESAQDKQALQRFQAEARAASALNHPNICTIHDIGECEDGTFIVMEWLEGESLRDLLRRTGLPPQRLLSLAIQAADGLAAAHAKGIVHRDIKPANLFVVSDDRVKILDFGVAKLHVHSPDAEDTTHTASTGITMPGLAIGTFPYMSPEQARGEDVDARSDLFSLAAVLFEMASRRRAFPGSSASDVYAAMLGSTPVLASGRHPQFNAALQAILNKGLEKRRDLRHQHASDLAADLKRLQRDLGEGRLPAAAAAPQAPPPLRRQILGDLVRATAVLAMALLAHDAVNRSGAGKYLDQFQLAFVQDQLEHGPFDERDFEAGGRNLPLVVDLSAFHPDKHQPTDRRILDALIAELRRNGARAIGVDLSFDDVQPTDFQYFKRWVAQRNVRIGVYRRAVERREAWLGRPEFADLAAGIAMPADNPQYAFAYSRRWAMKTPLTDADRSDPKDCSTADGAFNCKEDLYQLPVALWLLAERQTTASEDLLLTETPETRLMRTVTSLDPGATGQSVGQVLELGMYSIDYSYLKELRRDVITLAVTGSEPAADIAAQLRPQRAKIADRLVLVGDLEDTSDHLCYTPRMNPLPGALVHGCALATLNRGMLFQPATTITRKTLTGLVALLVAGVIAIRLAHARSRILSHLPHHHLEMFVFALMAVAVVLASRWLASAGVVWPNFIWFAGALAVFAVTGPFCRALNGVPSIVQAAVARPDSALRGG